MAAFLIIFVLAVVILAPAAVTGLAATYLPEPAWPIRAVIAAAAAVAGVGALAAVLEFMLDVRFTWAGASITLPLALAGSILGLRAASRLNHRTPRKPLLS